MLMRVHSVTVMSLKKRFYYYKLKTVESLIGVFMKLYETMAAVVILDVWIMWSIKKYKTYHLTSSVFGFSFENWYRAAELWKVVLSGKFYLSNIGLHASISGLIKWNHEIVEQ